MAGWRTLQELLKLHVEPVSALELKYDELWVAHGGKEELRRKQVHVLLFQSLLYGGRASRRPLPMRRNRPFQKALATSTDTVDGCHRFLDRGSECSNLPNAR